MARITVGELIGRVGNTGTTGSSHLHLQIRPRGGEPVDPLPWLEKRGVPLWGVAKNLLHGGVPQQQSFRSRAAEVDRRLCLLTGAGRGHHHAEPERIVADAVPRRQRHDDPIPR